MISSQLNGAQLELLLDWGCEPWSGVSPRYLTKGSCVVDKSEVGCPSREALRIGPDPAQLTTFLQGTPYGS